MKPIGPYVAVHELPTPPPGVAAAESLIQTLRATDRLTGIPVLLHVLPYAQSLPELPFSPHLLPVVDSGVDGELAYLVTELPLQAHPAHDPVLTARGALAALAALHDDDLTHGGVSGAQLWNVDGGVALAGAGLPWREDATPEKDLSDLAAALHEMGALPEALRPLRDHPGALKAREALFLLGGGPAATHAQPLDVQPPEARKPEPRQAQPPNIETRQAEVQQAEVQQAEVRGPERREAAPGLATLGLARAGLAPTDADPKAPLASAAASPRPPHDGTPIVLGQPDSEGEATAQWDDVALSPASSSAPSPTSPFSGAPSGQSETPQERRRRQTDERREQAALDSQAAAVRKAERLNAQKDEEERAAAFTAEQTALGVPIPEPFQIGFADVAAHEVASAAARELRTHQVERLPASLRRQAAGNPGGATKPSSASPAAAQPTASAAKRTLSPIRIGWDEDDSWRIVRTAPAPREGPPRWLWPLLALALLLGAAAIWAAARPKVAPVPAAVSCCAVAFTLGGAAGVTANLSVESAPAGANLPSGKVVGVIPGKITFPRAGLYRLRVAASVNGFRPGIVNVTVPSDKPVNINLGN